MKRSDAVNRSRWRDSAMSPTPSCSPTSYLWRCPTDRVQGPLPAGSLGYRSARVGTSLQTRPATLLRRRAPSHAGYSPDRHQLDKPALCRGPDHHPDIVRSRETLRCGDGVGESAACEAPKKPLTLLVRGFLHALSPASVQVKRHGLSSGSPCGYHNRGDPWREERYWG